MREMPFTELADLAEDPVNGWSIGSFGAIGEFMRDADEPVHVLRSRNWIELVTARGAMRLVRSDLRALAWDSLSSDGRGWSHNLALLAPFAGANRGRLRRLGPDLDAVRPEDRRGSLFDLGVSRGLVRMCVRTEHAGLGDALDRATATDLLVSPHIVEAILAAQPHRVLLSPAGRIEVFQSIPSPHERSPTGPHTHLLERLIAADRLHSANDPVPKDWQAALNMHPQPPWHGEHGVRRLDLVRDAGFQALRDSYGDHSEAELEDCLSEKVLAGCDPAAFRWPESRRMRIKARIILRRLDSAGVANAAPWRAVYDHPHVRELRKQCLEAGA